MAIKPKLKNYRQQGNVHINDSEEEISNDDDSLAICKIRHP